MTATGISQDTELDVIYYVLTWDRHFLDTSTLVEGPHPFLFSLSNGAYVATIDFSFG